LLVQLRLRLSIEFVEFIKLFVAVVRIVLVVPLVVTRVVVGMVADQLVASAEDDVVVEQLFGGRLVVAQVGRLRFVHLVFLFELVPLVLILVLVLRLVVDVFIDVTQLASHVASHVAVHPVVVMIIQVWILLLELVLESVWVVDFVCMFGVVFIVVNLIKVFDLIPDFCDVAAGDRLGHGDLAFELKTPNVPVFDFGPDVAKHVCVHVVEVEVD